MNNRDDHTSADAHLDARLDDAVFDVPKTNRQ